MNRKALKNLVNELGGYRKAAETLGVSTCLLSGLVNGTYRRILKEVTRFEICERAQLSEDDLFPFGEEDKESA